MCGIVGYVSTGDNVYKKTKDDFLRDALILDTFRGMDSTGVVMVNGDDEKFQVRTRRAVKLGWEFVNSKQFKNLETGWAAIGHNRAATKGKVNLENAHPFTVGPISLVHNGTLNDMGSSLPDFCKKQDVDSMNIARALAAVEPGEAAKEVLSKIRGAYALAWTDKRDKSVNLARNSQRPLHFSHTQGKSVLWFMSDGYHMDLMKKHRWCFPSDMGQIYALAPLQHFKWKHGSIRPEVEKYDPFVQRSSGGSTQVSTSKHSPSSTGSKSSVVRRSRKGKDVPLSHLIYLNGKYDVIPEALENDLKMTTDLTPYDLLRFCPESWVKYPQHSGESNDYGYAVGTAYLEAWDAHVECLVHNVHESNADRIVAPAWTIIPYATNADTFTPDGGFVLMAKVKNYEDPKKEETSQSVTSYEDDEDIEGDSFLGPFGRLYSKEDWLSLVRGGCCMCSQELEHEDHEEIDWVGESEQFPLCPGCVSFCDTDNEEEE